MVFSVEFLSVCGSCIQQNIAYNFVFACLCVSSCGLPLHPFVFSFQCPLWRSCQLGTPMMLFMGFDDSTHVIASFHCWLLLKF